MSDKVKVLYVNHTADHQPGDEVSLAEDEARVLVQSGMAQYAPAKAAPAKKETEKK